MSPNESTAGSAKLALPPQSISAEPVPLESVRAPRGPGLVAEVRSASTWAKDLGPKRRLYEQHGVRELTAEDGRQAVWEPLIICGGRPLPTERVHIVLHNDDERELLTALQAPWGPSRLPRAG